MFKILFTTDSHGSTQVWTKGLRLGLAFNVSAFLLCGDLVGKALVPFVRVGDDKWYYSPYGKKETITGENQFQRISESFENRGFYVREVTEQELTELKSDSTKLRDTFNESVLDRLEKWMVTIEEKVPSTIPVIVSPGNDDMFDVDAVIKKHPRIIYPVETVVELGGYEMISCEWVNETPWKTPRQCSEEELEKMLEKEFARASDNERLICNFHAPPYNTRVDEAPKLDKNHKPVTRLMLVVNEHVGSVAVRKTLERHQPTVGLHGHIHESEGSDQIGRTLVLNPGSEYEAGVFKGFVVDLPEEKKREMSFQRVEN